MKPVTLETINNLPEKGPATKPAGLMVRVIRKIRIAPLILELLKSPGKALAPAALIGVGMAGCAATISQINRTPQGANPAETAALKKAEALVGQPFNCITMNKKTAEQAALDTFTLKTGLTPETAKAAYNFIILDQPKGPLGVFSVRVVRKETPRPALTANPSEALRKAEALVGQPFNCITMNKKTAEQAALDTFTLKTGLTPQEAKTSYNFIILDQPKGPLGIFSIRVARKEAAKGLGVNAVPAPQIAKTPTAAPAAGANESLGKAEALVGQPFNCITMNKKTAEQAALDTLTLKTGLTPVEAMNRYSFEIITPPQGPLGVTMVKIIRKGGTPAMQTPAPKTAPPPENPGIDLAPLPVSTRQRAKELLEVHNALRKNHCAPPLKWSEEIAKTAQQWADQLKSEGCKFYHSGKKGLGENLAMGTADVFSETGLVKMWYDEEIGKYDFGKPDFSLETGHLTQLLWKVTGEIGCGVSICDGSRILVCNYKKPGNVMGRFGENVLPATCSKKAELNSDELADLYSKTDTGPKILKQGVEIPLMGEVTDEQIGAYIQQRMPAFQSCIPKNAQDLSGKLVFSFTIGKNGKIKPNSIKFTQDSIKNKQFNESAKRVIANFTFPEQSQEKTFSYPLILTPGS